MLRTVAPLLCAGFTGFLRQSPPCTQYRFRLPSAEQQSARQRDKGKTPSRHGFQPLL
jgi:hypothetical protein